MFARTFIFYIEHCRFALELACKNSTDFADSKCKFSRFFQHCRFALELACKICTGFADSKCKFSRLLSALSFEHLIVRTFVSDVFISLPAIFRGGEEGEFVTLRW